MPTLTEHPKGNEPRRLRTMIGFFGCARSRGGAVVRVKLGEPVKRAPQVVTLQCPACGHEHTAKPFWRVRQPDDNEATLCEPYTGNS